MPLKKKNKFLWFTGISVLLTFIFFFAMMAIFWGRLTPMNQDFLFEIIKQNAVYFFISFFLFFEIVAYMIHVVLNNFFIPLTKIPDEISVILKVNSSHRINIDGGKEILTIAKAINLFADHYETLQKNTQEEINRKRAELEIEKNMLASLFDELPQGIIACNIEGKINLFNKKAKIIEAQNHIIGIGRSIFDIIDKDIIMNALYEINVKKCKKHAAASSSFITLSPGNVLIQADISPITDQRDNFAGFIVVFYNIGKDFELYAKIDNIFKCTANEIFSCSDKIKKENLQTPEIAFIEENLKNFEKDYIEKIKERLPFLVVSDRDIITTVRKKAREKLNISLMPEFPAHINWIRIETYSFIYAFLSILTILKNKTLKTTFKCTLFKEEPFLAICFHIPDAEKNLDIFKDDNLSLTLKDFLKYHEAQIHLSSNEKSEQRIKILIPLAEMKEPEDVRNIVISRDSYDRPDFFDFDLFKKRKIDSKFNQMRLKDIVYTVFDTETTGLDTGNDEIISIGAVRVVNGRILCGEKFDQIIDPKMNIPLESEKFHGINDEMVKGKPDIKEILPLFYRFSEDTVLVAHNAAFDMKMFSMKAVETGIKFDNPVLDTLLLALIVYPMHERHNMAAIASFAGVDIVGRHTAMGDASATAEIFLKLIPLLSKKGIHTLNDALKASKNTLYSKLKY
ncbi:3'-5' exonuclease [Desulfobacter latus]|uniref:DNA polymerase III subunit epsilon n=1 Tax=Desulfobacter latus TaxID=2292 RepID=A0A850SXL7_9BACT|nr:3'-5' exonuclease [Desulfobacter latus]NWH04173.1 DNA polymerase III subunit epsilon [Desulfobacter latus]